MFKIGDPIGIVFPRSGARESRVNFSHNPFFVDNERSWIAVHFTQHR